MKNRIINLDKALPLKGINYVEYSKIVCLSANVNLENEKCYFPLERLTLMSSTPLTEEEIDFLKNKATAIVYRSGADDVRSDYTPSGIKVISSCDVGRGLLLYTDGSLSVGCPYQLWDGYLQYEKHGTLNTKYGADAMNPETYATGTWKGRKYFINMIITK